MALIAVVLTLSVVVLAVNVGFTVRNAVISEPSNKFTWTQKGLLILFMLFVYYLSNKFEKTFSKVSKRKKKKLKRLRIPRSEPPTYRHMVRPKTITNMYEYDQEQKMKNLTQSPQNHHQTQVKIIHFRLFRIFFKIFFIFLFFFMFQRLNNIIPEFSDDDSKTFSDISDIKSPPEEDNLVFSDTEHTILLTKNITFYFFFFWNI